MNIINFNLMNGSITSSKICLDKSKYKLTVGSSGANEEHSQQTVPCNFYMPSNYEEYDENEVKTRTEPYTYFDAFPSPMFPPLRRNIYSIAIRGNSREKI